MARKRRNGKSASKESGLTITIVTKVDASIWACWDPTAERFIGFLITELANIDKPIGFVGRTWGIDDDEIAKVYRLAMSLAREPSVGWRRGDDAAEQFAFTVTCVDLRSFGHQWSEVAMPRFVYGLRCHRMDRTEIDEMDDESIRRQVWHSDSDIYEPAPPCKFLAAAMQEASELANPANAG